MRALRRFRGPGVLIALAAVYFAAGKLGLRMAFENPSASPVWPPAGLALAGVLVLGYRIWPAILVAAFLVNVTTAGSLLTSACIAGGNTLEAVVGASLVERFARGRHAFQSVRDVFRFAILAAVMSTAVSATCGVTSLALGGFAAWADYGSVWLTWWLGDAAGDLIVAPFAILWSVNPGVRWRRRRVFEAVVLVLSLGLVAAMVFGGRFPSPVQNYPLEFLCLPFIIWAAFRFGQREVATAVVLLSGIAVWGTLRGFGPFVRETENESLLLLQAFMAVTAVTSLALAALMWERRAAEKRLRRLAVSDPLTGLGNYRRLISALAGEIRRSQRTERPFTVVLFDVDDLKEINDRYGHLAGNRALCRVADTLRVSCRSIDTAARFGGDEFALILPETGEDAARWVARRISNELAVDMETPVLSLSMGFAEYPRDGPTIESLLAAADRALYEMKAGRKGPSPSLPASRKRAHR